MEQFRKWPSPFCSSHFPVPLRRSTSPCSSFPSGGGLRERRRPPPRATRSQSLTMTSPGFLYSMPLYQGQSNWWAADGVSSSRAIQHKGDGYDRFHRNRLRSFHQISFIMDTDFFILFQGHIKVICQYLFSSKLSSTSIKPDDIRLVFIDKFFRKSIAVFSKPFFFTDKPVKVWIFLIN